MDGFAQAEAITKKYAKTFYFASRFLDKNRRNAAYAVYAICRISDETVDNITDGSPSQRLDKVQQNINSAYNNAVTDSPLLSAFSQTAGKYRIPKEYFDELIDGMRMDLKKTRYNNFDELHAYCYKVAGIVGLIMLEILGYKDKDIKHYAVDLGIAMQLTNILRDIKEDCARGRIYLPQDEIKRFGVSEIEISGGGINENFRALLKFQIARARKYYADSKPGIKMLNDSNSRFVVSAMADIYSRILNSIEKNNYDVFSRRAQVSNFKKVTAVLGIILKRRHR